MLGLLAIVAALTSAASAANIISNIPLNQHDAAAFCVAQGSSLIDVTSDTLAAVSQAVGPSPKWIGSWNGDSYGGACLVLTQGTVVVSDCNSLHPAVCAPHINPTPQPPCPHECSRSQSHSEIPSHVSSVSSNWDCEPSLPNPLPYPSVDCSSSSSVSVPCVPSVSSRSRSSSSCKPVVPSCPSSSSSVPSCESSSSEYFCPSSSYGPSRRSSSSRRSRRSSSSSWSCEEPAGCAYEYVYLTNTITSMATSVATTTTTTATVTSFEFTATVPAFVVTASSVV